MDRQDIINRQRENEAELKRRGVRHAALFGSRARGDAVPGSDRRWLDDIEQHIMLARQFTEHMSYDAFRDDLREQPTQ